MAQQARWDIYEAAILLDAYNKCADGTLSRSAAVKTVSAQLRKRALLAGDCIDSSFRNEAGISYQFGVMQYVMTDGKEGIHAGSALFRQIVTLFRTRPSEYAAILETALLLSSNMDAAKSVSRQSGKAPAPLSSLSTASTHKSRDLFLEELERSGVKFIDNRSKGGALWIVGGDELATLVKRAQRFGIFFHFNGKGGRATGGKAGWWTKSVTKRWQPSGVCKPGQTESAGAKEIETTPLIGNYSNTPSGFKQWMVDNGLALSSARSYSSAINNVEDYALAHGHPEFRFYDNSDPISVGRMTKELFQDPEFVALNNGQHNRLRAAIKKFADFVGGQALATPQYGQSTPSDTVHERQPDSAIPDELQRRITRAATTGFPNGIRPSSVIDRKKVGRLFVELFGEEAPSDAVIESALISNGIPWNGKVYLIDEGAKQTIRDSIAKAISEGHRLFYYDELYTANAEFYSSKMIYSPDALKSVMESVNIALTFNKNYCVSNRGVSIEDELDRIYGLDVQLTVEEIKLRLPFIPLDKIVPALSASERYVRVRANEYARVSGIEIDENDKADAIRLVSSEIREQGFATLGDVDLTRSLDNNPTLTEAALRDALFIQILSGSYSKKGQIVTLAGNAVSANEILRQQCREIDEATLDELDDLEKSITGQARNVILPIAFETMVRVDRDLFVNDSRVMFDVEAVDQALSFFVGDEVCPVKSVTSFNSFPYVGQPWTLFLLESFVARFSKAYRIDGGPARTDNVGAIFPQDREYSDYCDLLAHVLADAPVDLQGDDGADYLVRAGYVLRKAAIVRAAIERARMLRDLRG